MGKMQLRKYQIPEFFFNYDRLQSGENHLNIESTVSFSIPEEGDSQEYEVELTSTIGIDAGVNVLTARIRGVFDNEEQQPISKADAEQALKLQALPQLYSLLSAFISTMYQECHIKFYELPPLDEKRLERT